MKKSSIARAAAIEDGLVIISCGVALALSQNPFWIGCFLGIIVLVEIRFVRMCHEGVKWRTVDKCVAALRQLAAENPVVKAEVLALADDAERWATEPEGN